MASAKAPTQARREEREWTPALKGRRRKAVASVNESSKAAGATMATITDVSRRRAHGETIDTAYLAKISRAIDPTAAEKQLAAQAATTVQKSGWKMAAGLGVVAAGFLLAACFTLSSGGNHTVSGTFVFQQRGFGDAELVFHPADPAATNFRVVTSPEGAFKLTGLPAGIYKVTAQTTEDAKGVLPAMYTKLESTPFKLDVQQDLNGLTLYAMPPKRRAAQTPLQSVQSAR